jgi:hypothetical protein
MKKCKTCVFSQDIKSPYSSRKQTKCLKKNRYVEPNYVCNDYKERAERKTSPSSFNSATRVRRW